MNYLGTVPCQFIEPGERSRRVKKVVVDPNYMLNILQLTTTDYTPLVILDEIPDGAKIESIYYSYEHMGFDLVVAHESFPEVPDGEYIPATFSMRGQVFDRVHAVGEKCIRDMESAFTAVTSDEGTEAERLQKAAEILGQWATK